MTDEDWGSWESSQVRTYTRGMEIPIEDRLAWIESMLEFAHARGTPLRPPRDEWGRPLPADPPSDPAPAIPAPKP